MVDALVVVLLVLVLVALVVVGVLLARRGWAKPAEPAPGTDPFGSADVDAVRGDPRELAPGALVEIRGESYGVRGTLRLTEDGWSWTEHLLENAAGRRFWLSVEEDPELELVLFTALSDVTVTPGKTIELDGRSYRHQESGTATFTAEGTTGLDSGGTVHYQDYAAGDDARLSLESYGESGKWEVSRGEVLSRYEVRTYPAGN
ncbi:DUF4178 domain-containing protein [Amycolatopsis sp. 195334CR]|uniref:DUF4178 domain-containing protein n=1 Tax=Amycolatopsis sp. 195334CR TaxID=2814588 RepID=UPI001A8E450A|nr:DUF4178 domain-containing protein [Amycolatopsis sp. 195334CR]MBN6038755.1 DUF4178 domain-containing protein [Amycolatopsis sp. 195334CR]